MCGFPKLPHEVDSIIPVLKMGETKVQGDF